MTKKRKRLQTSSIDVLTLPVALETLVSIYRVIDALASFFQKERVVKNTVILTRVEQELPQDLPCHF